MFKKDLLYLFVVRVDLDSTERLCKHLEGMKETLLGV